MMRYDIVHFMVVNFQLLCAGSIVRLKTPLPYHRYVGQYVEASGLQNKPEYNGLRGFVSAYQIHGGLNKCVFKQFHPGYNLGAALGNSGQYFGASASDGILLKQDNLIVKVREAESPGKIFLCHFQGELGKWCHLNPHNMFGHSPYTLAPPSLSAPSREKYHFGLPEIQERSDWKLRTEVRTKIHKMLTMPSEQEKYIWDNKLNRFDGDTDKSVGACQLAQSTLLELKDLPRLHSKIKEMMNIDEHGRLLYKGPNKVFRAFRGGSASGRNDEVLRKSTIETGTAAVSARLIPYYTRDERKEYGLHEGTVPAGEGSMHIDSVVFPGGAVLDTYGRIILSVSMLEEARAPSTKFFVPNTSTPTGKAIHAHFHEKAVETENRIQSFIDENMYNRDMQVYRTAKGVCVDVTDHIAAAQTNGDICASFRLVESETGGQGQPAKQLTIERLLHAPPATFDDDKLDAHSSRLLTYEFKSKRDGNTIETSMRIARIVLTVEISDVVKGESLYLK